MVTCLVKPLTIGAIPGGEKLGLTARGIGSTPRMKSERIFLDRFRTQAQSLKRHIVLSLLSLVFLSCCLSDAHIRTFPSVVTPHLAQGHEKVSCAHVFDLCPQCRIILRLFFILWVRLFPSFHRLPRHLHHCLPLPEHHNRQ